MLLNDLYRDIWRKLADAVEDRRASFRCPVVAMLGSKGEPTARVMILRKADVSRRSLRFYTDRRSSKATSIVAMENSDPPAEVVFYDPVSLSQIRAQGFVRVLDKESSEKEWCLVPFGQRLVYCAPDAGKPVDVPTHGLPDDLLDEAVSQEKRNILSEAGQTNFLCFDVFLDSMDWLDLQPTGNVAARFGQLQETKPSATWFIP